MNWRMRVAMLGALALVAFTAMAGPAAAGRAHLCRGAYARPRKHRMRTSVAATLCMINRARHAHGLRPFRMNAALRSIAAGQSHDMRIGGYFGDNSLSGATPMQRIEASAYGRKSPRLSVGQNIAWGDAGQSTPAAIVAAWLSSGPHREILLTPSFQAVGVGISLGAPRRTHRKAGAIYTLVLAAR